jgi:PAS domain S-box-containing protein
MERLSRYNSLFDNFSTGVVFHDPNTQVLFANPAALTLLGLSMDQILGRTSADPYWCFIKEDGSKLPIEEYPVVKVLLTQKALKNFVGGVIRSHSAEPVWLICNAHPEFDDTGKIQMVVVNFTDITEQKKAENKLSDQLNLTQGMISSMLDGFAVLDENGKKIDVNPALCQMTGFSRSELLGKFPPFPYWPPEEYQTIQDAFEKTMVQYVGNFELTFIRKNGERFPVIVSPSHIKDKNGKIINYTATVKDITSRQQVENQLKELANQLSETYALAHIGVWSWNIELDLITWSEEMFRMSGVDPKLPTPTFLQMEKMHAPESWERLQVAVNNALATGQSYQLEMEYILPDGSRKNVNAFGGAKRDAHGKIVELFGSVQDITDKKQAELRLKAALKAAENAVNIKSKFLDIAAHELRTPVTAFSLLLQFTQKKFSKGVAVDLVTLERLRSQVDRISQLVIELLDVSRLERGVLNLKPCKTNLVEMIAQCISEFELKETNRRIDFKAPDESIELNIDSLRIYQVFSNLIDNAVKYTPDETPVEVWIEKKDKVVRVSVRDFGSGISKEHQIELFDPFFRATTTFTEEAGGLGLGLFISKELIGLHGGTIGVDSKEGEGSTFYFELPL